MYCPRCGAENDEGNRYCVSCGSELGHTGSPAQPRSLRERVTRLLGTTRRARIVTAASAAAVVVALIAFIAIKPSEDQPPQDAYTAAADRTCVEAKQQVAALEGASNPRRRGDVEAFALALVLIVEEWHLAFREAPVPPIHAHAAQVLNGAILDLLIQAGHLARVAHHGGPKQIVAQARRVDSASGRVDDAIQELGLERCAAIALGH